MSDSENRFKVRLVPISALTGGADPSTVRAATVSFDVTPQFSESRSVEYTPVTPVHMPGSIQIYKHTNSRTFEISANLISRNVGDAWKNMAKLQMLRGWLMPYFGATNTLTTQQNDYRNNVKGGKLSSDEVAANRAERIQNEGVQLRGAPPDVLYMYAYSTDSNDSRSANGDRTRVNINRVPVVITNLSISYPDDVDYIPCYDPELDQPDEYAEPFPKKLAVTVSLAETHSPREYENFDLAKYKNGNLTNF